ncbi:unnamed protein product [Rhizophagus irregularis]|nr:unnamed protein product [Rhizophagus irregularis]
MIYLSLIENNKNEITTDQSDHSEPINSLTLAEDKAKWIPYNKFKDVECLDKGKFGLMHKAILSNGNKEVVLKHLDKNVEEFLKKFKHYISCSESTEVFNVYGFTKLPDTPNCAVVMDYANKGSLRENLTKIIEMDWKQRLHILYKIISGLHEIHSQNLIHYNFHDGKILIHKENEEDAEDKFYISDLGLCQPVNSYLNDDTPSFTPFIAPEILKSELKSTASSASDIYSFSMIMWEFTSGVRPFNDEEHSLQLSLSICYGKRPEIINNIPQCYVNLMKNCWNENPLKRPSALEIKEKIGNWIFYNPDKIDDELKRDIEEFSKALNTNKILESESSVSEYQDEYNENQLII